jgi:hypothetical protein
MTFHSQPPSFEASNELSSPSYRLPQQVETPTYAVHLDGNGFLMNSSSERLSTYPSGRFSPFILTSSTIEQNLSVGLHPEEYNEYEFPLFPEARN